MNKKASVLLSMGLLTTFCSVSVMADSLQKDFLKDLAVGLNTRWEYTRDEEETQTLVDYKTELVQKEYDSISKYKEQTFEDEKFSEMAAAYISALEMQQESLGYFDNLFDIYEKEWDAGYDIRTTLIDQFRDQYGLDVDIFAEQTAHENGTDSAAGLIENDETAEDQAAAEGTQVQDAADGTSSQEVPGTDGTAPQEMTGADGLPATDTEGTEGTPGEETVEGSEEGVLSAEVLQNRQLVLYDDGQISVTLTGLTENDFFVKLDFTVNNQSAHKILVTNVREELSVNEYTVPSSLYVEAGPGKTVNATLTYDKKYSFVKELTEEEKEAKKKNRNDEWEPPFERVTLLTMGINIMDEDTGEMIHTGSTKWIDVDENYCLSVKPMEATPEVIMQVQTLLNAAGYDCGTPDGMTGPNTNQQIRNFAAAHGLPDSEEITEDLMAALQQAS